MFYLGCDQHARQITICLRDEAGDVVEKRQVSTQPEKIRSFVEDLGERTNPDGGYVAVVEVCGFNEWFLDLLDDMGCRQVILVQPEDSDSRKTDRRDAAKLSEQLWMNRFRRDAWMRAFYRRIKKRRGAKIARVAVMRRLCTVIYRMIEKNEPYAVGGPQAVLQQHERIQNFPSIWGTQDGKEEMALAPGG